MMYTARAGDVNENPVTGERGVVRLGAHEFPDGRGVYDLYVRPRGAVVSEHVHPIMTERFTVRRGRIGVRLNGREAVAQAADQLTIAPGVAHDWWNAGEDEALVTVEAWPARRFEEALANTFGLARDGKTNAKGMPNLLQLAVLAKEFEDVLYFTKPPRTLQRVVFGVLAPIARLLGYRGSYANYRTPPPQRSAVEPWLGGETR